MSSHNAPFRRAVGIVAAANLVYFCIEFTVAFNIGSVSLFADSIDFLEDTSLNLLILMALSWSARARTRVGMGLAGLLLIPGLTTLWMVWVKFTVLVPPEPFFLSLTGLGAFAVNLTCAFILVRHRYHSGSLSKAAFLSARNDAIANLAIIVAGLITAYTLSAWPDIIVGIGIALINADAARQIWLASRKEQLEQEELHV